MADPTDGAVRAAEPVEGRDDPDPSPRSEAAVAAARGVQGGARLKRSGGRLVRCAGPEGLGDLFDSTSDPDGCGYITVLYPPDFETSGAARDDCPRCGGDLKRVGANP